MKIAFYTWSTRRPIRAPLLVAHAPASTEVGATDWFETHDKHPILTARHRSVPRSSTNGLVDGRAGAERRVPQALRPTAREQPGEDVDAPSMNLAAENNAVPNPGQGRTAGGRQRDLRLPLLRRSRGRAGVPHARADQVHQERPGGAMTNTGMSWGLANRSR